MSGRLLGRIALGAIGVAVAGYGALLMFDTSVGTLVRVTIWLAGGVLFHDAVLAPLTAGFWWGARRVLPDLIAGPVAGGLLVLGALTLMAFPTLGQFRTVASNPTLLDRDYSTGWLIVAGVVLVGVIAWTAELAVRGLGERGAGERGRSG